MRYQIYFPKIQGVITARSVKWHDEPVRDHSSQSRITLYPIPVMRFKCVQVYTSKVEKGQGENDKQ